MSDSLGEKEVKKVKMEVVAKTNKGRIREQNEDYYYVSDGFNHYDIYMLADGMRWIQRRRDSK